MASEPWRVAYFVDDTGQVPVRAFRATVDLKTNARFDWSIEQLRLRNVTAGEPLVRHLEGKLWELREESNTNIYRLVYSFVPERPILLLHGFAKRTQKTPRREIEVAQTRPTRYFEREGR